MFFSKLGIILLNNLHSVTIAEKRYTVKVIFSEIINFYLSQESPQRICDATSDSTMLLKLVKKITEQAIALLLYHI